ncbi:peptidase S41 [Mucilaginibacter robiniae]|uniref:Tricorn protease homolog n=1 Tax=Mucilaginibacter robiniae TaxID=2728022 RepID=A0A7L5E6L2_9SPHI|nr:S41 family peptidase [Mucilaginibacter robiniae]QJD97394.1 peptidase S41 [Mucilaginibacter robiniae]
MKKLLLSLMLLAGSSARLLAQDHLLWMQQPALSPDGKWIAFEYKGNIFKVASAGGTATPLTINSAYNGYPIWSHDSKTLAFASDRYGNFDVYTMPADGGTATRLTYSSDKDIPYDFSADNQKVYFGTDRHDIYTSVRFPGNAYFNKLYVVPVKGGRCFMVNSAGTEYVHFNKAGDKFIYQDRKGYEDPWRKHHTSAVTRDIWVYDMPKKTYTKLSTYVGEDREPVWGEGDAFYYLSERNGNQNLYRASLSDVNAITQLTTFAKDPVRNLSRSDNGTLAFTQCGELYTMKDGQQPQKVNIGLSADFNGDQVQNMPVRGDATEIAVSPNGKEVAFIYRGEIFVTSAEGNLTKRITNTPYQERMIQFSPDGRSLLYSVENAQSWDIYKTSIANRNEPYFFAATTLNTEPVVATNKDEFQGMYSPDGKKVAYLEERNVVKVIDLATKKAVTVIPEGINYSYADGDQYFTWSPDSHYLLAQSSEGAYSRSEVALMKADGNGQRINLTESGFNDRHPQWGMNGKMMYWMSDKEGMKNLARGAQTDIYAMFFDQAAWDRFQLSKEDLDIRKQEEKRDSMSRSATLTTPANAKTPAGVPAYAFQPNLKNLDNRTVRITLGAASIADNVMSKDGEKMYYLAKYDKGYDLWVVMPRTHEMKVLANLNAPGGGLELSNDGKALFVLAGSNIMKVNTDDGKITPVHINSTMDLDAAGERAYIFEHTWKQVPKKFFDPNLQGTDWNYYHTTYAKFLPHINNNYDFQVLLSEFLGELNGSHTGGRYSPVFPNADETGALGLLYDQTKGGNGLVVEDVITGGPFDVARTKMKKGYVIDKIDGVAITDDFDWAKLLNHKADKYTLISFHDPKTGTPYQENVKPVRPRFESSVLMYNRWTHLMEKMVDSLSHGEIGYVHVQSMNDPSFRVTFDKVLGRNYDKKALIVDTRFNGGGWLHDELTTFLGGKLYFQLRPQGHKTIGGESLNKWDKPSCVLMSEGNYSDAFMFPYAYKELGLGKLIGMPVAGTGTAVWWENQIDRTIVFGIPMVSSWGMGETHATENHQLEPDIKVQNNYNQVLNGEDQQLEAAVKEMLQQVKGQ